MKKNEIKILEMLKNEKKREVFFFEINKTVKQVKNRGNIDAIVSVVDLIKKLSDLNIIKIN